MYQLFVIVTYLSGAPVHTEALTSNYRTATIEQCEIAGDKLTMELMQTAQKGHFTVKVTPVCAQNVDGDPA